MPDDILMLLTISKNHRPYCFQILNDYSRENEFVVLTMRKEIHYTE